MRGPSPARDAIPAALPPSAPGLEAARGTDAGRRTAPYLGSPEARPKGIQQWHGGPGGGQARSPPRLRGCPRPRAEPTPAAPWLRPAADGAGQDPVQAEPSAGRARCRQSPVQAGLSAGRAQRRQDPAQAGLSAGRRRRQRGRGGGPAIQTLHRYSVGCEQAWTVTEIPQRLRVLKSVRLSFLPRRHRAALPSPGSGKERGERDPPGPRKRDLRCQRQM